MTLRVRFEGVKRGSISVSLEEGEQRLSFFASYICPSLVDLVPALVTLLNSCAPTSVRWCTEPGGYDFNFLVLDDVVTLEVVEFPDFRRSSDIGHVVFTASDSRTQFILPFWRALRHLEALSDFEHEWGSRISRRDMQVLELHLGMK